MLCFHKNMHAELFFPPLLRARGVKECDLRQSRFPFADFRPAHDKLQTTFFFFLVHMRLNGFSRSSSFCSH